MYHSIRHELPKVHDVMKYAKQLELKVNWIPRSSSEFSLGDFSMFSAITDIWKMSPMHGCNMSAIILQWYGNHLHVMIHLFNSVKWWRQWFRLRLLWKLFLLFPVIDCHFLQTYGLLISWVILISKLKTSIWSSSNGIVITLPLGIVTLIDFVLWRLYKSRKMSLEVARNWLIAN